MCRKKVWKMNKVLKTNIHEFHLFLAYKIDAQKLKYKISKGNTNTIEL